MDVSGQRFINAPRAKVWRALQDARTLDACLQERDAVRRVSDAELQVGAPVHGRVTIGQSSPDTLVFESAAGRLQVTLVEEAAAMTVLRYVLSAGAIDATRAQTEIDELLEAFQGQVSGPQEFAADGMAGAREAAAPSGGTH